MVIGTIEVLGWSLGMDMWGLQTLVIWSALAGIGAALLGTVKTHYHWLWSGAAALVGGWLGSEVLAGTWGPVVGGLALLPALAGAVGLASAVDLVVRRLTGGSYRWQPHRA